MKKTQTTEDLTTLLASTYTLYLKTQNYHWNVQGSLFTTLHTLFETQYTELALAIDEIAERLRALGVKAPGSFSEFLTLSVIEEEKESPKATAMIETLCADSGHLIDLSQKLVKSAETTTDPATADLATNRITIHQKNIWMLKSHLE